MTGLLLLSSHEVKGSATNQMSKCSKNDISVAQGPAGTLPGGISQYLVQITNTNPQVPFADIHLNCKDFSSAILVSPEIFRRIAVDDCLVNDGRALAPGAALSFRYASTKQYPLPVVSATC
ncbi:hypothetical protein POPTR_010G246900v4 [Populus trichocarpa]|uniref:Uncharacterized protein n=1 Tax=Populus trichocarpa TaxID=3694 RepID=A0A2K1YZR9_POPTR|nr:hypothetical protein POPTR_010G246900v4 [Populus trichocarpa]